MCKACVNQCADAPDPENAGTWYEIECPDCNGRGCDLCDDGSLVIKRCPSECVPSDIWPVIGDAQLAMQGAWPVGGGTYDQSAPFVRAVQFVRSEFDRIQRSKSKS